MSRRRSRTEQQHLAWAAEVRDLKARAQSLSVRLGNAFPLQSPVYRAAQRALRAVEAIRSPLENAAASDIGESAFDRHGFFHYGAPREAAPVVATGLFGELPRGEA